jgi:ATP/maltotriose-dependent transcriptional regulator MalT
MECENMQALYSPTLISFAGYKTPRAQETQRHDARNEERESGEDASALLALSHTRVEHSLYLAMAEASAETGACSLTVRDLMVRTGVGSYSTIRRGLAGLAAKLSVERRRTPDEARPPRRGATYTVFSPEEIFARRRAAGLAPYPREIRGGSGDAAFRLAVRRVSERHELSRREAQVALSCAEGLTNAEIGEKLFISEIGRASCRERV